MDWVELGRAWEAATADLAEVQGRIVAARDDFDLKEIEAQLSG